MELRGLRGLFVLRLGEGETQYCPLHSRGHLVLNKFFMAIDLFVELVEGDKGEAKFDLDWGFSSPHQHAQPHIWF